MSEERPDVRWAPREPAPKRRGRVWLIVGLIVAALAIVAALLFFFLPRGDAPEPGTSESPSPSATPTETVTPTPSVTPEPTPVDTPPAPVDPDLATFRGQVGPRLDDALTGLGFITGSSLDADLSTVDQLQGDAQRLSDTQPPSTISSQWRDGVADYSTRLDELRSAISEGTDTTGALDAANSAVEALRATIGL